MSQLDHAHSLHYGMPLSSAFIMTKATNSLPIRATGTPLNPLRLLQTAVMEAASLLAPGRGVEIRA
jgi:hypothetical protein